MLQRILWGTPQENPSLDAQSARTTERIDALEKKVKPVNDQLRVMGEQLRKYTAPATQAQIRNRIELLRREKQMYDTQIAQLRGQRQNMEQVQFATVSMENTAATSAALKAATHSMQAQLKTMPIADVHLLADDLQQTLSEVSEINDVMSRSFVLPYSEAVDDTDLDTGLAALADELEWGDEPPGLSTIRVPNTALVSDTTPAATAAAAVKE